MASKYYFDTSFTSCGKTGVRLLKIKRSGEYHEIKELEVETELRLSTYKEYQLNGENGDVIPTDTQKNTIYALAKKHEINKVEDFAIVICNHFLTTQSQVESCTVHIVEAPWRRIVQNGVEHDHAFISVPEAKRFCDVFHKRGEPPKVAGGIQDMRILKTTKSGFEDFNRSKFTTLPETAERTLCTIVYFKYTFDDIKGMDFDAVWKTVKDTVLKEFAGPPNAGQYSASIQSTLSIILNGLLTKIPQLGHVVMDMPNVHYFAYDMSKLGLENNDEVMMPTVNPFGAIRLALSRKSMDKM